MLSAEEIASVEAIRAANTGPGCGRGRGGNSVRKKKKKKSVSKSKSPRRGRSKTKSKAKSSTPSRSKSARRSATPKSKRKSKSKSKSARKSRSSSTRRSTRRVTRSAKKAARSSSRDSGSDSVSDDESEGNRGRSTSGGTSDPALDDVLQNAAKAVLKNKGKEVLTNTGIFWLALLTVQFGVQAHLTKHFLPTSVSTASLVLTQEFIKIALCVSAMVLTGESVTRMASRWDLGESLRLAGIPAAIYAVQNVLVQESARRLDPLVLNLVNQSKLIATAVFVYILLGRAQSQMQCVALGILAAATAMLASSNDNGTGGGSNDIQDGFFIGFTACLLASLLSGIASALCQGALQGIGKSVGKTTSKGSAKKKKKGRNSFLYSAELALFSISAIFITSIVYDFNSGGGSGVVASLPMPFPPELGTWGLATLALNAFGGICVGQVVKHAGSVRKAFAIVAGISLSAFITSLRDGSLPSPLLIFSTIAVATACAMHAKY